jgi:hypothetical protein
MHFLTWREVDFPGVLLTGLVAGYLMAMVGLWGGRMPGLVAIDIADFGRRYMVSDRASAWLFGMGAHLANSIILVLAWATLIEPNLHWWRPLEGMAFGLFLMLTLAGAFVSPLTGLGFLGHKTGSAGYAMTAFLMHLTWGFFVGLIYVPR